MQQEYASKLGAKMSEIACMLESLKMSSINTLMNSTIIVHFFFDDKKAKEPVITIAFKPFKIEFYSQQISIKPHKKIKIQPENAQEIEGNLYQAFELTSLCYGVSDIADSSRWCGVGNWTNVNYGVSDELRNISVEIQP